MDFICFYLDFRFAIYVELFEPSPMGFEEFYSAITLTTRTILLTKITAKRTTYSGGTSARMRACLSI